MIRLLDALGRGVVRGQAGSLADPGSPLQQEVTFPVERVTGVEKLIGEAEAQREKVQTALRRYGIRKAWRETARLLVLGSLLSDLTTLSRLLRGTVPAPDPRLVASLKRTLARLQQLIDTAEKESPKEGFYHHAYRETAWELDLELRVALLELGDACYLATALDQEQELDQQRDQDSETNTRWSDLYDPAELYELLRVLHGDGEGQPDGQAAVRRQAIEMLARLYQQRSDDDRGYRAQEMLRVARLRWTCYFLSPLLVGLAGLYIIVLNDGIVPDWRAAVRLEALTAVPAALGGTLGIIRGLRQDPLVSRSGEQPRYRWADGTQILISGTLGLIVLALAVLQILPAFRVDPQTNEIPWGEAENLLILSLYGFLAGFSEAFAISSLQRFVTGGAV
jgi:hypothetical protein